MTIDDCFLFHFEVQQALIDDIEHRMDGCLWVDSPQIVGGCWVMIRFLRHFLHSNESIVLEQNNRLLIVLDWRHIPSLSTWEGSLQWLTAAAHRASYALTVLSTDERTSSSTDARAGKRKTGDEYLNISANGFFFDLVHHLCECNAVGTAGIVFIGIRRCDLQIAVEEEERTQSKQHKRSEQRSLR